MGYTTDFTGQIKVEPPLSTGEIDYLKKFSDTRRMNRHSGPYYIDGSGFMGQDRDSDIIDYNQAPSGQPGLWCNWTPTDCGCFIEWNGGEKFSYSEEWMEYLIAHFIGSEPVAKAAMQFLQGHVLNGEIQAQGEEPSDKWTLIVTDNKVSKQDFVFSTPKICCPHCDEEFYLEQSED